jgi:trimethylamine:corrinoid methyltransferase-like protein
MLQLRENRDARRLRVDSCLSLIQDVSQRLSREGSHPRIVEQLQHLDEILSLIDHQVVTDSDLERIEGSTNQLMKEIGLLFDHQGMGSLYQGTCH